MAANQPPPTSPRPRDPLGFYRIMASFPVLESYRGKLFAVVGVAFAVPLFFTLLAIVLGAGRMSVFTLFLLLASLLVLGCGFALWGLDRLLAPLDSAVGLLDAHVEGKPVQRVDVPGTDTAAQLLRDVQALTAKVKANDDEKRLGAERDSLTGLWNRTAGRKRAKAFLEEAFKRGRSVRIIVGDVDRFAELNANHGPIACDLVLKSFAQRLTRAAGDAGLALRWDGDRFVVIQAGPEGDFAAVDEIVARAIVVKGQDEPVTLSVGVAEANEPVTFERLLGRAEVALRVARAP